MKIPAASSIRLLSIAQRLQALSQAGITYQVNAYDLERYEEIRVLSSKLLQEIADEPYEKIVQLFATETGYQTPKVDIRAVVFKGTDQILMVREKMDHNRWTLPGGWADVGCTPFEVAVKETREETGLLVKPIRLLALFDKRKHGHPPQAGYAYKAFIRCEAVGGALLSETGETLEASWRNEGEIKSLELSLDRVTVPQLETLFGFARNPELPALCD